ncbi:MULTISPECIES: hypothetical protein [Corallococcus]|uniref:hypothetical protein n=1 Tax=Corallococcus TaxID=83461 RepID=UPI0011C4A796|nr:MULTISPECIES: hypothetical protein [Corallococcus]
MRDIASELAVLLEGTGLGLMRPPAPDANLFTAPLPEADGDVPDMAVALMVIGGDRTQFYIGASRAIRLSLNCLIRVRSACEDFNGGQQLAYGLVESIGKSLGIPNAFVCAEEGAPEYSGADDLGRHRWVIHLSVRVLRRF